LVDWRLQLTPSFNVWLLMSLPFGALGYVAMAAMEAPLLAGRKAALSVAWLAPAAPPGLAVLLGPPW